MNGCTTSWTFHYMNTPHAWNVILPHVGINIRIWITIHERWKRFLHVWYISRSHRINHAFVLRWRWIIHPDSFSYTAMHIGCLMLTCTKVTCSVSVHSNEKYGLLQTRFDQMIGQLNEQDKITKCRELVKSFHHFVHSEGQTDSSPAHKLKN